MVLYRHPSDAPLPIHPIAFTNGSSISVFLHDDDSQSVRLLLDMSAF